MRKIKDRNNKGFSLVELVVVVLIMAIVAVALAPQVMKWVENSRISSDLELRADIENACILAMTEESAFERVKDGGYKIIIEKNKDTGDITHSYQVNRGGSEVTLHNGDADLLSDPFWQNFIKVGNFNNFDNFENSTIIKSVPKNGEDIRLEVYVYEGGYTFSELDGVTSDELNIS